MFAYRRYMQQDTAKPTDVPRLKAIIEVGRKAQMVVDHPAWQSYIEHLEAMRDEVKRKRDSIVTEIVEGDKLGEELAKLKLQCDSLKGELAGLSKAIDLIPELLKRATDAVQLMDKAGENQATAAE